MSYYEFWEQLPKTIPEPLLPKAAEAVEPEMMASLTLPSGEVIRVLTAAGLYWVEVRIPQAITGQPEFYYKPLTPPLSVDQILTVAEAVLANNQRITTWQYTVRVLAMGVALGLTPDLEPVAQALDEPARLSLPS